MKTKLFFATLVCFLPLRVAAQTADEIVKKALDARGGIDKIKAVQSERISGRISFSQGIEGTVVLELKRLHRLHSEITVEGQKILRVYDGISAGWTVNPFVENKDVQPMPEEELKGMPEEAVDGSTFLTVKWEGIRKIADQDLPWECALSDYRDVKGLKYPFKIDQGSPGTEFKQTLTIEKVEVDAQIDDAHFAKPVSPGAPASATP